MKNSFHKFMASNANNPIRVELGLDDVGALVTNYFQITDNAQSKAKGILSSLREVMAVYDNALKQESYLQNSKATIEKMANDFQAMGVTVKPSEWKEYRDLLLALKDISAVKQQAQSIQKAIALLS